MKITELFATLSSDFVFVRHENNVYIIEMSYGGDPFNDYGIWAVYPPARFEVGSIPSSALPDKEVSNYINWLLQDEFPNHYGVTKKDIDVCMSYLQFMDGYKYLLTRYPELETIHETIRALSYPDSYRFEGETITERPTPEMVNWINAFEEMYK